MRSENRFLEFKFHGGKNSEANHAFSTPTELKQDEVRVKGRYTSLTFKDYLVSSGAAGFGRLLNRRVGTDYVGVVTDSRSSRFKVGEEVCLIATPLGSGAIGGVSEVIVARDSLITKIPEGWSPWETIVGGTPALTAALAWQKLSAAACPRPASVAISGVGGGVGMFSLLIANMREIDQISVFTQKSHEFFKSRDIRVGSIVSAAREGREQKTKILPARWESGIDVMGGSVLQTMLKACSRGGAIGTLGVVQSSELNVDLAPFFLRNIKLFGVNLENEISGSGQLHLEGLAATKSLLERETPKIVSPDRVAEELKNRGQGTGAARVVVDLDKFN